MKNSARITLFILFILSIALLFTVVISRGISIETNILKLLPETNTTELSETVNRFSESQTGETVFMVTHENEDSLISLAYDLETSLHDSKQFVSIQGKISDTLQRHWYNTYFPYRYSYLTTEMTELLQKENRSKRLFRQFRRKLYSATPDYYGSTLNEDPFQLFPEFMQSLFETTADIREGYALLPYENEKAILITASVDGSPFDATIQESVEAIVAAGKQQAAHRGGKLYSTGILRFAHESFRKAKGEISLIGTLSLLGVLLILIGTFRSFSLITAGILPVLVGLFTGFTVTSLFFPYLHVIALTMGASLTGIAIDYSLHYLSHATFSKGNSLKAVFPGITLGAITTAIGYGVLGISGFPGFQQIALFTVAALLGSYITVVWGFPLLIKERDPRQLPFTSLLNRMTKSSPYFHLLPLILIVISIAGLFFITPNDDIFSLRTPLPDLDLEEVLIRQVSEGIESSRFVIVTGRDDEELLQNLSITSQKLDSLEDARALQGYISLSTFVKSQQESQRNSALFKNAVTDSSFDMKENMTSLGIQESAVEGIFTSLMSAETLTLNQWLKSPISAPWRRLYIDNTNEKQSIILLKSVLDEKAMADHFSTSPHHYFNKVAEVSSTLGTYRRKATLLTITAYVVIYVLLLIIYGVRRGSAIFFPPVLAATASFMIPGIIGVPITFMHIMALLLVLGIGIDYTIFFSECKNHRQETVLAVVLSACSTILAFGVLWLSATPGLQAIGMIITPGILFSLLLAPLALKR